MLRLALILCLLGVSLTAVATPMTDPGPELKQFRGLKSLFQRIQLRAGHGAHDCAATPRNRYTPAGTTERQAMLVGQWQQFRVVARQVIGTGALQRFGYEQFCTAFSGKGQFSIAANAGAMQVDHRVERMHILGYTLHEIADILSGRITRQALKNAQAMRAAGYNETAINAYLERHYRVRSGTQHHAANSIERIRLQLDALVLRHARRHGVDPNLVRAVISNESSWRIAANSSAGAIGPMQLMPATAKMLGVDPNRPEQNIEGGVRYLAGLLRLFKGDVDAALVAYNAGPAHAMKWRKGDTVLYGETRSYLKRVKSSYAELSF